MYKLLPYKKIAQQLNARTYTEYFNRFNLIARALFRWNNLPNNMDERWVERFLFWEGAAVFYKDPVFGYMVAKVASAGKYNYYNDPVRVKPILPNMPYQGAQLVNGDNCVIIRNNDDMIPTAPTMQFYALKIANIERTIDVNITQQKTPIIVRTSDKQRLSFENALNQRNENEIVIVVDKEMDIGENVKVFNTQAPIVFDKLELQKHMVYNECMTFLGINNANMDKRERVQSAEVAANDNQIAANEDVFLKARKRAAEEINLMFGTNITVERRNAPALASMETGSGEGANV